VISPILCFFSPCFRWFSSNIRLFWGFQPWPISFCSPWRLTKFLTSPLKIVRVALSCPRCHFRLLFGLGRTRLIPAILNLRSKVASSRSPSSFFRIAGSPTLLLRSSPRVCSNRSSLSAGFPYWPRLIQTPFPQDGLCPPTLASLSLRPF